MYTKCILIITFLATMLTSCNLVSTNPLPPTDATVAPILEFSQTSSIPTISPTLNQTPLIIPPPKTPLSPQQTVLDKAFSIIEALKNKDMAAFSQYVHPQKGLRFSPYATVKDIDQLFAADQVAGLMDDPTVLWWGNYDGSGEPINLTFAEYYSKFVYDVDFGTAPQLALNHRLGVSTSMDNIFEFYQSAMFVEYYFPGFDTQLEGMDWRSLRLVFTLYNNTWYLVGIIHDQWTT